MQEEMKFARVSHNGEYEFTYCPYNAYGSKCPGSTVRKAKAPRKRNSTIRCPYCRKLYLVSAAQVVISE